jgi:hypothetical protein
MVRNRKPCLGYVHPVTKRCRKTCAQRNLVEHPQTKKCVKPCKSHKTRKASNDFKCKVADSKDKSKIKTVVTGDEKRNIVFIDYSERSFAVAGDTKPIKDILKELGGKYNANLKHPQTQIVFVGWMFPLYKRALVEKRLGLQSTFSPPVQPVNDKELDEMTQLVQKETERQLMEQMQADEAEKIKLAQDEARKAQDEAKKAQDAALKAHEEAKKALAEAKRQQEEIHKKKAQDEVDKAEADAKKKASEQAKKAAEEAAKAVEAANKSAVAAKHNVEFVSSLERYAEEGRKRMTNQFSRHLIDESYKISRNYIADYLFQKYAPQHSCRLHQSSFILRKRDKNSKEFIHLEEVAKNVVEWMKTCAKPDIPFILHYLSMREGARGHANVLYINLIDRKVYRFEPFGQTSTFTQIDEAMEYITQQINTHYVTDGRTFIYVPPSQTCPNKQVFQRLQKTYSERYTQPYGREKEGLCVYWSYLIMEALLRNPSMSYENVIKHCNDFFKESGEQALAVMRGYASVISRCVLADKNKYKPKHFDESYKSLGRALH